MNFKNLLFYFYFYVWLKFSYIVYVYAGRGRRSILGVIIYCSLPETCLVWLTGLWAADAILQHPISQLTWESVYSVEFSMLQAELEDSEEKGWIGPASLCFGLPLGEQVSLPCLLVTLIFYPRKMDRAFGNRESKHTPSLFRHFHPISGDRCEKTNTGSSSGR